MPRAQRFLGSTASNSSTFLAVAPEAVDLESNFIFILAALLCSIICTIGFLAVVRCACLRLVFGAGGAPLGSNQTSANKGVKKKVLQSLPKCTYDVGAAEQPRMESECAICLVEFAEGDEIRVLPPCGHVFHVGCIDTWLESHSSCPSCRQMLVLAGCHKCGYLLGPPISEAELKARQDHNNNHLAPAVSAISSISSSNTTNTAVNSNSFLP